MAITKCIVTIKDMSTTKDVTTSCPLIAIKQWQHVVPAIAGITVVPYRAQERASHERSPQKLATPSAREDQTTGDLGSSVE